MVLKEIATRQEIAKDPVNAVYSYDFCNDQDTLIDILLQHMYALNEYYDKPTIIVHANAVFIKTVQSILSYFHISNPSATTGFIVDDDMTESSTYSNEYVEVFKETQIGFKKITNIDNRFRSWDADIFLYNQKFITNNKHILFLSLCYKFHNSCKCLPNYDKKFIISNSYINDDTPVSSLYYGNYSKLRTFFSSLQYEAEREKKTISLLVFISARNKNERQRFFSFIERKNGIYSSSVRVFHCTIRVWNNIKTSYINCKDSLFLNIIVQKYQL